MNLLFKLFFNGSKDISQDGTNWKKQIYMNENVQSHNDQKKYKLKQ